MAVRSAMKNGFIVLSAQGGAEKMVSFLKVHEYTAQWLRALAEKKDAVPAPLPFLDVQQLLVLSSLKGELLGAHDRESVVRVLARYLPQIGIKTAAVFVQEQAHIMYVGGFFGGTLDVSSLPLSAQRIFPPQLDAHLKKGIYYVCPFSLGEDRFGYALFSHADMDEAVYRDIACTVGNAMQTVYLMDELMAAKTAAERAMCEKNEFFANAGGDLCDPLADLSAKITQMEANVENGILDADILSEQLLFLKSQVAAQLEKTETLVELSRVQMEDVPMDKKLFAVASVLPSEMAHRADGMPLLFGDAARIEKTVRIFLERSGNAVTVRAEADGVHLSFDSVRFDWKSPALLLAEKNILLQYGSVYKADFSATVVLPYPNLAGLPPLKPGVLPQRIYAISPLDAEIMLSLPVGPIPPAVAQARHTEEPVMLYWNPANTGVDMSVKFYAFRHDETLARAPLLCYDRSLEGQTFLTALKQQVNAQRKAAVLFVNARRVRYGTWATDENAVSVSSIADIDAVLEEVTPALIVFESVDETGIKRIRANPRTVLVPVLVIARDVVTDADVDVLCAQPRTLLCNYGVVDSEPFSARIMEILHGDDLMPSHTGALVKKAILYLNKNCSHQIVRWKLADTVHVSEDYLTRVFHKELGLSLWEYLNRYRLHLAERMLMETNATVTEIAEYIGYQDHAYFCRVFKKAFGVSPGKIRAKQNI